MNQQSYENFVEGKDGNAKLAVVILVDSHNKTEAKQMIQAFQKVTNQFRNSRLRIFYLCYKTYEAWLESLLEQCVEMKQNEVEKRVVACLSGNVATIVALLGFKKQLCIFPEDELLENTANSQINEQLRTQSVGDVLGSLFDLDEYQHHSMPSASEKSDVADGVFNKTEQVEKKFEIWMEKLIDGSLRRYKVTNWPTWYDDS